MKALLKGSFGDYTAEIYQRTTGRYKGKYSIRGGGYATSVVYHSQERAMRNIESDARFVRWL